MKLLFYSPVSLLHGGGCEHWHLNVLPVLKERYGHEIKIITGDYTPDNLSLSSVKRQLKGIEYETVPLRIAPGGAPVPTKEAVQKIRRAMKEAQAMHFVFGFVTHDLMLKRLKKETGTKIIVGIHAPLITESTVHNWYVSTVSRFLTLPYFDGFLIFNPEQQTILKKWGFNQLHQVGGGVDTGIFCPDWKAKEGAVFTCLYVGRFEHEKGVDILCAGIDKLLSQSVNRKSDLKFQFVGSGSLDYLIKELVKKYPDQVELVGYVDDPVPYLQRASILVVPSRQESFGIVVVEALATGTPVLASNAEGPRTIIDPNETGWIVKPLNSESLAVALKERYRWWQDDKSVLIKWGKKARAAASHYSIESVADRLNDALQ